MNIFSGLFSSGRVEAVEPKSAATVRPPQPTDIISYGMAMCCENGHVGAGVKNGFERKALTGRVFTCLECGESQKLGVAKYTYSHVWEPPYVDRYVQVLGNCWRQKATPSKEFIKFLPRPNGRRTT